jgi:hypothetical protein
MRLTLVFPPGIKKVPKKVAMCQRVEKTTVIITQKIIDNDSSSLLK